MTVFLNFLIKVDWKYRKGLKKLHILGLADHNGKLFNTIKCIQEYMELYKYLFFSQSRPVQEPIFTVIAIAFLCVSKYEPWIDKREQMFLTHIIISFSLFYFCTWTKEKWLL